VRSQAGSKRQRDFLRRNTLPELPGRLTCLPVRTRPPPRDPTAGLQTLQMARQAGGPQGAVPQATLGSLATMLMACSFFQVFLPRRAA